LREGLPEVCQTILRKQDFRFQFLVPDRFATLAYEVRPSAAGKRLNPILSGFEASAIFEGNAFLYQKLVG
jgi:hypothetical protein